MTSAADPPAADPAPAAAPPAAGPADVHLDTDRNVAVLTLGRPAKLNALTSQMTAALAGHVAILNADPAVRVVVITGGTRPGMR